MTEQRRRWGLRLATWSFITGVVWLLFGVLWVVDAVIDNKTGPLPWITAAIGFVCSAGSFAAAWSLRRRSTS